MDYKITDGRLIEFTPQNDSTELLIPESLQKEITIYDFALPTLEETLAFVKENY